MRAQSTPTDQTSLEHGFRAIPRLSRKCRRRIHRVTVRLAQASDRLPSTVFIEGVALSDQHPVGGGSYADVYKGDFNGVEVAVKKVRIFIRQGEDEWARARKVWDVARGAFGH